MRKNNKNKGLKVGDRIKEGSRYGKIVAFHTTGTVDVIFDGESYPMRRQLPNVSKANRKNPRRRKNSGHLPPISVGKKLEPLLCSEDEQEREQFGELIWSLFPDINDFTDWENLPTNSDVSFDFSTVTMADEFEKWAMKAFSSKVDVERYPTLHSVWLRCRRGAIVNPDIERIQFEAQVQGIYESQVRDFLGLPYNTPFENKQGKRIDQKLTKKQRREILSGAFAIATAVGRKHGYLHRSPDRSKPYPVAPTKKGVKRILERVSDPEELRHDQEMYEETLRLARKNPAILDDGDNDPLYAVYDDELDAYTLENIHANVIMLNGILSWATLEDLEEDLEDLAYEIEETEDPEIWEVVLLNPRKRRKR